MKVKLFIGFFVGMLLVIVTVWALGIYMAVSAASYVEKHGLKSVVSDVWNGEQNQTPTKE